MEDEVNYFREELKKARIELEIFYYRSFSDDDLYLALANYYDMLDMPPNLIFKKLSSVQMIDALKDYDLASRYHLGSVVLNKTIIPRGFPRLSRRVLVKVEGEIWQIHLYDKDPFPSNPHAHNFETNLKLHLGNGKLFNKRQLVGRVAKKDLPLIRERINIEFKVIVLPELCVE
jgi:hypothetical protein